MLKRTPGFSLSKPGAPDGHLPEGWYQKRLRGDQPRGGRIRGYAVRGLRTTVDGRELDVDFVIRAPTLVWLSLVASAGRGSSSGLSSSGSSSGSSRPLRAWPVPSTPPPR